MLLAATSARGMIVGNVEKERVVRREASVNMKRLELGRVRKFNEEREVIISRSS
jgi:hypothetical protein